jgi:hypothetical protein
LGKRLLRKPKRGGVTFYGGEIVEFCVLTVVKVKVKLSRYRPDVAQRVGRGIALLFLVRGIGRG